MPSWRSAPFLTRTQPSLSNSSDEIIPVTLKKDPNEQVELQPFSRPEHALTQSFRLLNSDNWEKEFEGLMFLHCLAWYHPDVLNSRLHDVCLALIQEVRNLCSKVSHIAVVTLGELYFGLQKGVDQELEATDKSLECNHKEVHRSALDYSVQEDRHRALIVWSERSHGLNLTCCLQAGPRLFTRIQTTCYFFSCFAQRCIFSVGRLNWSLSIELQVCPGCSECLEKSFCMFHMSVSTVTCGKKHYSHVLTEIVLFI